MISVNFHHFFQQASSAVGTAATETNQKEIAGYEGEYIRLKVVGRFDDEVHFRVKQTTKMGKIMKSYSGGVGLPDTCLRFLFDGRRINEDDTAESLEMKQDDVVDVFHCQPMCEEEERWLERRRTSDVM